MAKWLIIDLRRNHCYIRLADEQNSQIEWLEKPVPLRVLVSLQTFDGDDRIEPQLCFYRERAGKSVFQLIDPQELNHIPNNYEVIEMLFAEPPLIDEEMMIRAVYRILRNESVKKYYDNTLGNKIKYLYLVDTHLGEIVVSKLLAGKIPGFSPESGKVVYLSPDNNAYEGFALLSIQGQADLPRDDQIYTYVENSTANEKRSFIWRDNKFQTTKPDDIKSTANSSGHTNEITDRFSGPELERLGAVGYAIFWQTKLAEIQRKEIDRLNKMLQEYTHILEQARLIRAKLLVNNR